MILPPEAIPLITAFAPAFTQPTYRRFLTLLLASILTTGRRTIANLLGALAPGHRTDYQRVLSRAPWSTLELGCVLWVVLAVLVLRFPWASRPWALPILVDLDRSPEDDRQGRRTLTC